MIECLKAIEKISGNFQILPDPQADAHRDPDFFQRFDQRLGVVGEVPEDDRHLFGSAALVELRPHPLGDLPGFVARGRGAERL